MVVSMTGYGIGMAENTNIKVTVEIKTVNHRFCEYHIRMPRQLFILEDKVKRQANEYIRRGRVEIFIAIEGEGLLTKRLKLDWSLADQYFAIMSDVKDKYSLSSSPSLQDLLHINDVFSVEEIQAENEELDTILRTATQAALSNVKAMRLQEGAELKIDLLKQLEKISFIVGGLKNYAPAVAEAYKERLKTKLAEVTSGMLDESRLLTEVAIFADKADINEELTRLESHHIQFLETLEMIEPIGRKLDFLVQEMNREVNTIGSKANDSTITKEVVEMKSLLEKIKEQVQNIE
ncbi:YicC/YloC family endoribonuclease [Bacillus sp. CECT 9360]|uniref:YicC/YloC family endoribonuclease n=1 Tax=Bacillus sp. CECT 9360 TaxID=2845821 RepID=UPI001E345F91|nr:YicC/YloC family endoribonuclease [Bacillus sp. CECT 9360]CAH0346925.1 hypothetical protein BCI9360_03293 [Bacillus sp. CECT 9360]